MSSVSLINGHIDPDKKEITNYEKIKAMSIDEMAKIFAKNGYCEFCKLKEAQTCDMPCEQGVRQYLESEVEEE